MTLFFALFKLQRSWETHQERMKSDQLPHQLLMLRVRLQLKRLQQMKKLRLHFPSHKKVKCSFQENSQMIETNWCLFQRFKLISKSRLSISRSQTFLFSDTRTWSSMFSLTLRLWREEVQQRRRFSRQMTHLANQARQTTPSTSQSRCRATINMRTLIWQRAGQWTPLEKWIRSWPSSKHPQHPLDRMNQVSNTNHPYFLGRQFNNGSAITSNIGGLGTLNQHRSS